MEMKVLLIEVMQPSLRIYQRGFHWTDFREILHVGLLRKFVEDFKIWFKSGTLLENLNTFYFFRRH
jgi:hypothetical protein